MHILFTSVFLFLELHFIETGTSAYKNKSLEIFIALFIITPNWKYSSSKGGYLNKLWFIHHIPNILDCYLLIWILKEQVVE